MITVRSDAGIGRLVLDRPRKLNALLTDMIVDLGEGVRTLIDERVSVIVVESSGDHFCAGADLTEWAPPSASDADRMSRVGVDVFRMLATAPMPSIAAINGVAAGGGLELALACDLRVATTTAQLGLPEAGLANLPAYGGIDRLVEVVGVPYARELLFTAELISGERAAQIGLVNRVVAPEDLDQEVTRLAQKIVAADSRAVAFAKSFTGGTPVDALLATFTSQTEQSRGRKQEFLARQTAAKTQN